MKFEGEVRELELIPSLVELGSEDFTGALRFENDSIIKIVYFKDGSVLSASTNDRGDSIDEILLKSGKVSRDHVKQALSKRKDDETLGDALLGLGFITRKELTWARRVQLVGILRSILAWDTGSYTLVADYLPKREEGPSFQLEQVVLELVLTDGDRGKYDTLLESGAVVFSPSSTFEARFPSLGLNQEAESVVRLINGTRTATDVIAESTSDAFNVYKLMHALHLLRLLDRSQSSFDLGSPAIASRVEPTIELPMDFGAPQVPNGELSWKGLGDPEPASSAGELLPSIDDSVTPDEPEYDYKPSAPQQLPQLNLGGDTSSLESMNDFDVPVSSSLSEPDPEPIAPRILHAKNPPARKGGRVNIAFLAVALLVLGGLAYAGYLYFLKPAEEPAPAIAQTQEPTGVSASTDTAAEPEPPTATEDPIVDVPPITETVAEPVKPPVVVETPKPAPVPPVSTPSPAPASGRYAEIAKQNVRAAAGVPYTVQFALLCQEYSVENAVKVGGSDFWFVPTTYQGKSCYRAFWGRYPTSQEAERGVAQIPASLRGGKAVVVQPSKLGN